MRYAGTSPPSCTAPGSISASVMPNLNASSFAIKPFTTNATKPMTTPMMTDMAHVHRTWET